MFVLQVRTPLRYQGPVSASSRPNGEGKISQGSSLGQGLGGSAWQTSGNIWSAGAGAIGERIPSGKREPSRTRGETHQGAGDSLHTDSMLSTDENTFSALTGSGALAASSEADTWVPRGSPWNTTSPTLSTSTTSPRLQRSSDPLGSEATSPYPLHAQPSLNASSALSGSRPQARNTFDPATGSFQYIQKAAAFSDDQENHVLAEAVKALKLNHQYHSTRTNSQGTSGSPSHHSESGSKGTASGRCIGNGYLFAHTPNSSINMGRPSAQGRNQSFPSATTNGNTYAEWEYLNRLRESQSGYEAGNDQEYAPAGFTAIDIQQLQNGFPLPWVQASSHTRGLSNHNLDNNADGHAQDHYSGNERSSRRNDRGSASPADEYRRPPRAPGSYQANSAISAESESAFLHRLRQANLNEQEPAASRLPFVPSPYYSQQMLYGFQGQYNAHGYDYPPQHNYRMNHNPYSYPTAAAPYASPLVVPRGPKEDDHGLGIRSQLLEEFRCNGKTTKRYELKDIYGHVVEFSGDQHGSRFIQQKLEVANSDEKEQVFREIQPNALQLMTDVFGNYVIQKIFEHGDQVQKRLLAEQMKNHVLELSVQMYGCRVVQKALEHVLADQQAELVRELQQDVMKCVKDQNGNHVVQKAIERVSPEEIRFIIDAFRGQVHPLATHAYGCRVIQRMLEFCSEKDQAGILEELHASAHILITDQYGNYVMQHVIARGKPEDRAKIIHIVTGQLLTLSKHKFASNVVEKTIQYSSDEERRVIVATLTALNSDGSSPLQHMIRDQYGNYVVRKLSLPRFTWLTIS